jgi:hypothetical protein
MLLGQIVEPLVVRDNALQCPIASICIRLPAMKTGDRPRRDTGVIDDWDDNDSPCLLALREGTKLSDDQPLDLVFGLWNFFHDTDRSLAVGTSCQSRNRRLRYVADF